MFKKNIYFFAFIALALSFGSCKKEMSGDEPFPDKREQTVFITTNSNRLYGYEAGTGLKTWEKTLSGNVTGSPVIADDAIFMMTNTGNLHAFDLLTKEERFAQIPFFTLAVNNSLAAKDELIFVPSDSLYGYSTQTGDQIWAYGSGNGQATTSVTLFDDKLYVGFSDEIHCLKLDGTLIWQSGVSTTISTTLKVTNNAIFFGGADNKMYSVSNTNGALLWSYTTASFVLSSPLVYGGMSISGSDDNNIYCVDHIAGAGQQGQLRWSVPTKERVRSSAAIHRSTNTVLIGCHDFNLYAIDHVSGKLKWKYPTGSLILSSPVVMGNHAFFASYDQFMYCIDVRTGSLVWKTSMDYTADGSPVIDDVTSELYSGASGMSQF